jgi:hypothetical protein
VARWCTRLICTLLFDWVGLRALVLLAVVAGGVVVVWLGAGFAFVVGVDELERCCSRMMAEVVVGVVMVIRGIVAGEG